MDSIALHLRPLSNRIQVPRSVPGLVSKELLVRRSNGSHVDRLHHTFSVTKHCITHCNRCAHMKLEVQHQPLERGSDVAA